jgi:hypothetical protein
MFGRTRTFSVRALAGGVLFLYGVDAHAYKRFQASASDAGQCAVNYPMTSNNIAYGGGPIIANVQVVPVFWTSAVDPSIQAWAPEYLSALANSAYMDL